MANAKQKKGFTKKILGGSELTMEYAAYITAPEGEAVPDECRGVDPVRNRESAACVRCEGR